MSSDTTDSPSSAHRPTAADGPPTAPAPRTRIATLDVLRGLALCGIMIVNLPAMFGLDSLDDNGDVEIFYALEQDFVQNRFFPIFSILFGIGFGIMWNSARTRSRRPRLALLRRFLFLGVLGTGHMLLQPGEALLPYAIVAIVILLPSTFIPARVLAVTTAIVGAVLLAAGVWFGGGPVIIPGLFLLGFAIGHTDMVRRALRHPGRLALIAGASALISVLGFLVTDHHTRALHMEISAGLGITMALCFVTVAMLLMLTPAEAILRPIFAPLGRMALSNYIGATLLILAAEAVEPELSRFDDHGGYLAGVIVCVIIMVIQILVSALWLRFVGQGPLEKLWRLVTWGREGTRARGREDARTRSRENARDRGREDARI
ncbi:DUF418 domain-containing protein [Brevibacterium marinum]|uniref:Putative membrane protein YeiB n=1 Tax=Brevibacterium marinum TaxID=418643 RepID=A0A846S4M7_9MICO|nr:DUF418 domain-containing protein [Brevibacterium marinum]NJC57938.1 putative membrane protein YeiB [Brevibacterium marinum]